MSNTYHQICYHIIFTTKNRQSYFSKDIRNEIFNLIGAVIKEEGANSIIVGGHSEHVHLLVSIKPKYAISDFVAKIKSKTNHRLKERNLVSKDFEWQLGYGAFSFAKKDQESLVEYIKNQESHHQNVDFKEEFIAILKELNIDFDERYVVDELK